MSRAITCHEGACRRQQQEFHGLVAAASKASACIHISFSASMICRHWECMMFGSVREPQAWLQLLALLRSGPPDVQSSLKLSINVPARFQVVCCERASNTTCKATKKDWAKKATAGGGQGWPSVAEGPQGVGPLLLLPRHSACNLGSAGLLLRAMDTHSSPLPPSWTAARY